MKLVVMLVGLEVVDCVLPVRREDVFVLTMQTLVDIGPCTIECATEREYVRGLLCFC